MSATLLGLLTLAGLTTLLGRLVARVARVTWLDRNHPDVLPLQAALGTAVLTCLCATASHAGLGQNRVTWLVAGICAVLVAWAARRRAPGLARPNCRSSEWLPVTVAIGAAAVVGLLPVVWLGSFSPFGDAFYYSAVADWLVRHGVAEIAPRDPMKPALAIVSTIQPSGLRLGSSYLQAFVAALLGRPHALLVFYAVSCWGFILLAACVFCLGRRVFRLSPWLCTAAVCTMVCIPVGSIQALQGGFQAQPYGLSALIALLCATARLVERRTWTPGGCIVLGALLAWQTSAYSEVLPLAGVVLIAWLAVTARRAVMRGHGRTWRRAIAVVAVSYVLLGNLEIMRAVHSIPRQLHAAVGTAGWQVQVSTGKWLGLFAGTTVYPELPGPTPAAIPIAWLVVSIVILTLCIAALWRRTARPLLHTTRAATLVLGLMVVYFAFIAINASKQDAPTTMPLYKVSQWLHPLIIVSAWAGARRFLRGRRTPRVAAVVAILMVGAGLPIQIRYAEMCSRRISGFAGSDRPLAQLERLSDNMAGLAGQQLYVVTRPQLTNPRYVELLGYFTIQGRAAGLWSGCPKICNPGIPWTRPKLTDVVPPERPLTLLCHRPFFRIPGARKFGCKVVAVPVSDAPVLCQVDNPSGWARSPEGQPSIWIGGPATTLVVFAPHAGRASLTFEARPGPALKSAQSHLAITTKGTTATETIDFGATPGTRTVSLSFGVATGVNEISLACTDEPRRAGLSGTDPWPLMVSFADPTLSFD
jgi:hypothetical protein